MGLPFPFTLHEKDRVISYNMKINVAFPATGCQKLFEINDEIKVRPFYEKRMGQEVDAATLGDEWAGYVFRITGGNDKQGFPMKQGVLTALRVRLLLSKGHSCYRQRRSGERKRKSVRGCIVDGNLSVISVVIVKKGDNDIPGLTDTTIPRRLGPKRASKIRKLFNLTKDDNVCQYVIKRPLPAKEGKKPQFKAPKVQRLVTQSCCKGNVNVWLLSASALRRTVKPLLNTPRFWLKGKRKPRRPRKCGERGPLPSVNQGTLSRARKLLCLKIVVAFHAKKKKKKKKKKVLCVDAAA